MKRLMIDQRIPRGERSGVPVVVDATGSILWVAGLSIDQPGALDPEGFVLEVVPVER